VDDALHPLPQGSRLMLEIRRGRLCKQGLLVLTNPEMECVEGEALAADFLEPSLHDRPPNRVVPEVLRGDPDTDHAVGAAPPGNDGGLACEPLRHQSRTALAVALEEHTGGFFVSRRREGA